MQKKSLITKFIVALVLVAFVTIGINSYNFDEEDSVAKIGNKTITVSEFDLAYKKELAYIKNTWGENIDEAQLESFGLKKMLLRDMINAALINHIINQLKLDIGDELIIDFIKNHTMFQNDNKIFDREKFITFLQENNIAETEYIAKIKEDFLKMIFFKLIPLKSAHYPKVAEKIYASKFEKRSVEIRKIAYQDLDLIPSATDEELKSYFQNHANNFSQPEQRNIKLFTIKKDSFNVAISETDIKAELESMKLDKLFTVRYVFFSEQQNTEPVLKDDPKALWEKNENEAIQLHKVFISEIPFALNEALAQLKIGEPSIINEKGSGFYLVMLDNIEHVPELEKQKHYQIIKKNMIEQAQIEAFDNLMSNIRTYIDEGKSLSDFVISNPIIKVQLLDDLSYENPKSLDEKILNRAFNTAENQLTDFYEDSKGNYYAIEVLKVIPEHVKQFEAIKPLVKQHWKKEQQFLKASSILMEDLQNTRNNPKIIKENKTFNNIDLDSQEHLPSGDYNDLKFTQAIFLLNNIGNSTQPSEDGDYVKIAILKNKTLPTSFDEKDKKENVQKINKMIQDMLNDTLFEELIHYYAKIFKVETKQKFQ